MQINLNVDLLKADGMTNDEIAVVRQCLDAANRIDNTATVVRLNGNTRLVCKTVGLAIAAARPAAYLGTVEEASSGRRPSLGKGTST